MRDRLEISTRPPKRTGSVWLSKPHAGVSKQFLGLPWWAWVLGTTGGIALVAWAFSRKKGVVDDLINKTVSLAQEGAFAAALPSSVRPYAGLILNAANTYGVSPWTLAGIMYRESGGGSALKPKGPGGTGDWTPRRADNSYFKYANPATGLPPDGLGWGRGLMQHDYGAQNAWVTTHDWADASTNILHAAEILSANKAFFQRSPGAPITIQAWRLNGSTWTPSWRSKYNLTSTGPYPDPRPLSGPLLDEAVLASYNGGTSGVLQALAARIPPSAATANGDYASWIVSRTNGWQSSFA